MGFNKVTDIPYQDWERTDTNLEKRKTLLHKAVKEAKKI